MVYLGRIDTQVKIRGLRIELGDIENIMSTFEEIHMCTVTDKKDENGRQYMGTNYFVHLPDIPMTPSGKTDESVCQCPRICKVWCRRMQSRFFCL